MMNPLDETKSRGAKETSRMQVLMSWFNEKEIEIYNRCIEERDFESLKKICNGKIGTKGCKCAECQECPACQMRRVKSTLGGQAYFIKAVSYGGKDSITVFIGDKEDSDYEEKVKLTGNRIMKLLQGRVKKQDK